MEGKMEYKEVTYTAIYEPCEEGGFAAYLKELPGVNTQGETLEEAKDNLREAFELIHQDIEETLRQQQLEGKGLIQEDIKFLV